MYQQIYEATMEEGKSNLYDSEDVRRDRAQVNAHLNVLAENGRLRVSRIFRECMWVHRVEILDENGDVLAECGGHISVGELNRDSYTKSCLSQTENMGNGFFRIDLMISDIFPDIYVFKRDSGKNVDLGFNDYSSYYIFSVILHENDFYSYWIGVTPPADICGEEDGDDVDQNSDQDAYEHSDDSVQDNADF